LVDMLLIIIIRLELLTRIGKDISKIALIIFDPPCLLNLITLIIGGSIKEQIDFEEVELVELQVHPFSIRQ